jgi:site-specific recombinase XerD
MAKVIHLRAPQQPEVIESPSDVLTALNLWLEIRPENTRRVYLRIAEEWSLFLGQSLTKTASGKLWKKANAKDAQAFVNDCRQRPAQQGRAMEASPDGCVSMATVRHKASVLKAAYDSLVVQRLVTVNPFLAVAAEMRRVKPGERRRNEGMEPHEVKKFLTFVPLDPEHFRDRAIFHLMFGAALRRSELVDILLSDIITTNRGTTYLRLRKTKSQVPQKVSLPEWVADEVLAFKARRVEEGATERDLMFVRYLHRGTEPMGEKYVYRLFKDYLKRFKLNPDYSPHCARVTAITQLLSQGLNHREVQELSRHSSVSMVERYDRRRFEIDESPSKKLSYD